jgi:hypothetical protein
MPIMQPGRADVHVNKPLTQILVAYMQDPNNFVAGKVFPRVMVNKQSDRYFTYDKGSFNRNGMQNRASGTASERAGWAIDSTPTYYCPMKALHVLIPIELRANADDMLDLDRDASQFLGMQALIHQEVEWSTKHFTNGVWGSQTQGVAAAPTTGQALQWNDPSSNPIEDIRIAKRNIQERTGFLPNKMVISARAFDAIQDHPDLVGRLDRGQTSGAAKVKASDLAYLFDLDEVHVMQGVVNISKEGAADVHQFIGGKHAMLCYAAPRPGIMVPSAGYTFTWNKFFGAKDTGARIRRWWKEDEQSDKIEIDYSFDQKVIGADLGHFFKDIVA